MCFVNSCPRWCQVHAESGPKMASRLGGCRGPQHFLALTALLVAAVLGLNYWRLAGTNSDLQDRIHRLQQLLDLR